MVMTIWQFETNQRGNFGWQTCRDKDSPFSGITSCGMLPNCWDSHSIMKKKKQWHQTSEEGCRKVNLGVCCDTNSSRSCQLWLLKVGLLTELLLCHLKGPEKAMLHNFLDMFSSVQFSSVQFSSRRYYALGKANLRSTLSLRGFPNVAFETSAHTTGNCRFPTSDLWPGQRLNTRAKASTTGIYRFPHLQFLT